MTIIWGDFDTSAFWEESDWHNDNYVEAWPDDGAIAAVQAELGYRLPVSYIELMRTQNGGCPANTCYPTDQATSWASDHVAITGLKGIGRTRDFSLCGKFGSRLLIEEWGYPPIGVYFADCPSAGHDMLCLDYRESGPDGEPQVVHIDQECGYVITVVAASFEGFVRGLQPTESFELD